MGKFSTFFLTVHEGIEILAHFSPSQHSTFLRFADKGDDIVVNRLNDIDTKIIIHKRLKTLPLLSYKDDDNLKTMKLNKKLKLHIDRFLNFFRIRGLDSEDLEIHDTTIWFVSDDPRKPMKIS